MSGEKEGRGLPPEEAKSGRDLVREGSLVLRDHVYSVTEITQVIKAALETAVPQVWVVGEISNCRRHPSGHIYFTLKDAGAALSAAVWKSNAARLKFELRDGQQVVCRGRIDVYPPRGSYQLNVDQVEPKGKGALQLAFEQLKEKLRAEGLFDPARKKKIPLLPKTIGVVTSPTGAALIDILRTIDRRFAKVRIVIYPARVQGAGAAAEIVEGLEFLGGRPGIDVIIVGRGGGSIEDLWAFNEEPVARAIAASPVPVISAVGHEVDFTISDFVADISAAAEIAVPDESELRRYLAAVKDTLRLLTDAKLKKNREALNNLALSHVLKKPGAVIDERRMDLLFLGEKLSRHAQSFTAEKRARLSEAAAKLNALSPLAVLGRGYTLATDKYGSLIVRAAQLNKGDEIEIVFDDGAAGAVVKDIKMR